MDSKETGWSGVDCIILVWIGNFWWAFTETVLKFRFMFINKWGFLYYESSPGFSVRVT
jgi:hypothetical protein